MGWRIFRYVGPRTELIKDLPETPDEDDDLECREGRLLMTKLERQPTTDEVEAIQLTASKPCDCSADMKVGVYCKPCAARSVLNGIVTLAPILAEIG